ncbi:hypothetical protein T492DRAFT_1037304 [Pavlovales sp. CCMP2436]|nr:hypothetical protein T492DRAFT_1037304 [Pavlovales sp. CCMP2436]
MMPCCSTTPPEAPAAAAVKWHLPSLPSPLDTPQNRVLAQLLANLMGFRDGNKGWEGEAAARHRSADEAQDRRGHCQVRSSPFPPRPCLSLLPPTVLPQPPPNRPITTTPNLRHLKKERKNNFFRLAARYADRVPPGWQVCLPVLLGAGAAQGLPLLPAPDRAVPLPRERDSRGRRGTKDLSGARVLGNNRGGGRSCARGPQVACRDEVRPVCGIRGGFVAVISIALRARQLTSSTPQTPSARHESTA